MEKNGSTGLGLNQLASQIKGQGAFTLPKPEDKKPDNPPKPEEKKPEEKKPETPPKEEPKNILEKPITISDATARPTEEPSKKIEIPSPDETKDASSPFAPFANVLKERGLLSEETLKDTEVKSVDDIINALNEENDKRIQSIRSNFIEQRSPEAKRFIEMLDAGVPLDTAQAAASKDVTLKDFTEDNLRENKDLQKHAVEMYLKSIEVSEDDIKDQIDYFTDMDKLYEKSVNFAKKMQTDHEAYQAQLVEQQEQQRQALIEAQKKQVEDLKNKVYETPEIIPGKALSDKTKQKLFESITTPVGKDPNGQPINKVAAKRMEDPVGFEIKLHYLNELGVFDDKWDGLIQSAKTKATEELEKALQTTKGVTGNTPSHTPDTGGSEAKSVVDSFKSLKQQLSNSKF